jgi:hypothetical protein
MTDQPNHSPNNPTHLLYRITGEGKAARRTLIGTAWPNQEVGGYSIYCRLSPLAGRIVMCEATEPKENGARVYRAIGRVCGLCHESARAA